MVHIGIDPLTGADFDYTLPYSLLQKLHSLGYKYLCQINKADEFSIYYWLNSWDLGLTGTDADRWECYIHGLSRSGINLVDREDKLAWDFSPDGSILAKFLYDCMVKDQLKLYKEWWHPKIWKWNLPPKLKCFWWSVLNRAILTWENLLRRGVIGPSICVFCRDDTEDLDHLFGHCKFTSAVWSGLGEDYSYLNDRGFLTITENFEQWTYSQPRHPHTPVLICWVIWRTRNKIIFEQEHTSMSLIFRWIINLFSLYPGIGYKQVGRTHVSPPLVDCPNVGSFDGRAELLSLWALLWLAKIKDCWELQIFGDSKTIIDLINGRSTIRNSALIHWYQKICDFKRFFGENSFQHIYREYNDKADLLSKEALSLGDGLLMLQEEGNDVVHTWEQFFIY